MCDIRKLVRFITSAALASSWTLSNAAWCAGIEASVDTIRVNREILVAGPSGDDTKLRFDYALQAHADAHGVLTGQGVLKFEMSSPRAAWNGTEEFAVEGTYRDGRLRIVGPKQMKYTCVNASPPPDPKMAAHYWKVGDSDKLPLSDDFSLFDLALVGGQYGPKTVVTEKSGSRYTITTQATTTGGPTLVERLTVGGRVERGDVFSVAVGETRVLVSATGSTPEAVAAQLAAAWTESAASTGIVAVASGSDVWLTAADPDRPFTCRIDTTEADGERSDGQTFASSLQFIAGSPDQGLWKKEVRHCGRLLGTFYSNEPSPTVGYFDVFICPVCRIPVRGGEWSRVR